MARCKEALKQDARIIARNEREIAHLKKEIKARLELIRQLKKQIKELKEDM